MHDDHNDHEQVTRLLPWFVNGSLDVREMQLVETHVNNCPACAKDLRENMRLSRALQPRAHDQPDLQMLLAGSRARFDQLQQRLAADSAPRTRYASRWATALVLTITLGTGFAGGWGARWLNEEVSGQNFEAMTNQTAGGGTAYTLQLVFAGGVSEVQAREILLATGGVLADTPSTGGVYRLRLPDPDSMAAARRYLDTHQAVRWVAVEQ